MDRLIHVRWVESRKKGECNDVCFTTGFFFVLGDSEPVLTVTKDVYIDFSAVPNDGNDDTAALQSALDWADSVGTLANLGTLTFPSGVYDISSTLTIGDNTTLEGADLSGDRPSVIIRASWPTRLLVNKNTSDGNSYIQIRKIEFNGNNTNLASPNYLHGVFLVNSSKVKFVDCEFNEALYCGVYIKSSELRDTIDFIRCKALGNSNSGFFISTDFRAAGAAPGVPALPSQQIQAGQISGVTFSECSALANGQLGIALWGVDNAVVENCEAIGSHYNGFSAESCRNVVFSNCTSILNGGRGMGTYGNRDYIDQNGMPYINTPTNITFYNCISENNGETGLTIDSADTVSVVGGRFSCNGKPGINIQSRDLRKSRRITVQGVQIRNNQQEGMTIKGAEDVRISGTEGSPCLILDNGQDASGATYNGIACFPAVDGDTGNDIISEDIVISGAKIGNTPAQQTCYMQLRALRCWGGCNRISVLDCVVNSRYGTTLDKAVVITDGSGHVLSGITVQNPIAEEIFFSGH